MKNKMTIVLIFLGFLYTQDIDPVYTGSFGSVTINNQVYNQFSLRPELTKRRLPSPRFIPLKWIKSCLELLVGLFRKL